MESPESKIAWVTSYKRPTRSKASTSTTVAMREASLSNSTLGLILKALALLFRGAMSGRMGIIVLSALVAHTAWHWMLDRADVFWQTPWPQPTVAGLMVLARWIVAVGLAVGAAKLLANWIERKWPGWILPAENRVDA